MVLSILESYLQRGMDGLRTQGQKNLVEACVTETGLSRQQVKVWNDCEIERYY